MITFRRAHILLGSICATLILSIGYECFFPLADIKAPPFQLALPSGNVAASPSFKMPPAASFAAIDERPIFDSSRRPVASPPDVPSTIGASVSLPSVTLIGVIIDHETRLALVKLTEASVVASYSVGAWLGNWQIVQIEADKIVLRSNGLGTQELRMTGKSRTPPSPANSASDGL